MRIKIRHDMFQRFEPAVRGLIQSCRLNPRNFDGQYVKDWRIDVDADCRLKFGEDGFGNLTQTFSIDGPVADVPVSVEFKVDTTDTAGIVRGAVERFPAELFLRATPLTLASEDMRAFADAACSGKGEPLAKLHALLPAVCDALKWEKTRPAHDIMAIRAATDAFAAKSGGSAEIAHVFVACARHQKIPARFISGFCMPGAGEADPVEPPHCWAEAWAEGYGWIGFDAAIGICTSETHVRGACGFDWHGAAPSRTAHAGVSREIVDVKTTMAPA